MTQSRERRSLSLGLANIDLDETDVASYAEQQLAGAVRIAFDIKLLVFLSFLGVDSSALATPPT